MVPAICSQCGAQVNVDASQETAFCSYCGAKFIVEKAINNYNIKTANIGHADTINVYAGDTAENLTDRALIMLKDNQSRKARELFEDALNKDPYYWKAYLGLFMFSRNISSVDYIEKESKPISNDRNFKHAVEYAPHDEKMRLVGYANAIDIKLKKEKDELEFQKKETERIKKQNLELKTMKEKSNTILIIAIASVVFCFSGLGVIPGLVGLYLVYQYRKDYGADKKTDIAFWLSITGSAISVISIFVMCFK